MSGPAATHQSMSAGPCLMNSILISSSIGEINAQLDLMVILTGTQGMFKPFVSNRATCNSTRSLSTMQTQDGTTFNLIFSNLYPYTNYTCCVETLYSDSTENDFDCATNITFEGIPGPPTNLIATPSLEQCNQVTFMWDLPPTDEQNGDVHSHSHLIYMLYGQF